MKSDANMMQEWQGYQKEFLAASNSATDVMVQNDFEVEDMEKGFEILTHSLKQTREKIGLMRFKWLSDNQVKFWAMCKATGDVYQCLENNFRGFLKEQLGEADVDLIAQKEALEGLLLAYKERFDFTGL